MIMISTTPMATLWQPLPQTLLLLLVAVLSSVAASRDFG